MTVRSAQPTRDWGVRSLSEVSPVWITDPCTLLNLGLEVHYSYVYFGNILRNKFINTAHLAPHPGSDCRTHGLPHRLSWPAGPAAGLLTKLCRPKRLRAPVDTRTGQGEPVVKQHVGHAQAGAGMVGLRDFDAKLFQRCHYGDAILVSHRVYESRHGAPLRLWVSHTA